MIPSRIGKAILLTGALALAVPFVQTDPAPARAAELPTVLPSFAPLVKQTAPAVVTIQTSGRAMAQRPMDPQMREFLERFFGRDFMPPRDGRGRPVRPMGLGSGFIISGSGIIVTNNHVVDRADQITVILDDGEELEATLIGTDPKTDLAVLRVQPDRRLPTVRWGDSDSVEVGDWAIAIGNPFGLGGSVTAGIVSARGRNIRSGPYDDFLQIDAPINRGNSGGPLFDQQGRVIGVNTAIFSPTGGNVGIGFAIPSNQAREIVAELIETGTVERGWLGVSIQSVTGEIADNLGLDRAEGALIADLADGGPAERDGLRRGDVILSFDGKMIGTLTDLTRAVADTDPGTRARVTIWRDGRTRSVTVRTGKFPS